MNLRNRIRLAAAAIRAVGVVMTLGPPLYAEQVAGGLLLAVLWLLVSRQLLRQHILPALFSATICPGCRRIIPLVARWKCGDHYTDHRERHILSFRCTQGHRLEGFDCPRCKATILVQRGHRPMLRHGTAIRLRTIARFSARGLLIGHDPRGRPVHLPWAILLWHVAIFGGTGRGKSTLLARLAEQLIAQGIGFTALDCGDLAATIFGLVPAAQRADVLNLDVSDTAHPFALNILYAATPMEAAMLTEELIEVFRRMYGSAWGPVLEHQLRMGLRAAISAGGTIGDVYDLFTSASKRAQFLPRVTDGAAKSFWVNEFPTIPAIRRSAVVNKLAPIVFHPILGPIIGARECILNADDIIANSRIVIANLRTGSPSDYVTDVLGTFLVQKIVAAAFRQGAVPESQRVPHVLIVDEFSRFLHRHQAAGFDQVLSEARRYRLSLLVATQYAEQIDPSTRAAIFGNVGAILAFRVGPRDARVLQDEFSGSVIEDFTELGVGRCLARIGTDWTAVRTLPPPAQIAPREEPAAAPIQQSSVTDTEQLSNEEYPEQEEDEFVQ